MTPHIKSERARKARLRRAKIARTLVLIAIMILAITALEYTQNKAYQHGYNQGATDTNNHWMTGFYHAE